MRSSSPARTPKLRLAAEQSSIGECWDPPKKDTLCPRAKEKLQQDGRRATIAFKNQTSYPPEKLGKVQQNLVYTGTRERNSDPQQETEPDLPVSV